MSLPVTIIGGYLGAGKTTLVNHLLRNTDGLRLAILVNEFGELPIDEDLIEAQDDTMISIAGGCVCCSYGNDLTMAMMDLAKMDPRPDQVVLESSGVALPGAIAASVSLLQEYSVDGVIVLADAETIRDRAEETYMGDTIQRQLADADIIVLNKADLVSSNQLAETKSWLETRSAGVRVLDTQYGEVAPSVLFQGFLNRAGAADTDTSHATFGLRTESLLIDHPVDAIAFAEGLSSASLGLVRAKGFVQTPQNAMKTLQIVGARWCVSEAPDNASEGLVLIGPRDTFDMEAVRRLVAECRA